MDGFTKTLGMDVEKYESLDGSRRREEKSNLKNNTVKGLYVFFSFSDIWTYVGTGGGGTTS